MKLTEEEKKELVTAIANDIYRRATWAQVQSLVQTQCTNQAVTIVDNATDEEIDKWMEVLNSDLSTKTEKLSGD